MMTLRAVWDNGCDPRQVLDIRTNRSETDIFKPIYISRRLFSQNMQVSCGDIDLKFWNFSWNPL